MLLKFLYDSVESFSIYFTFKFGTATINVTVNYYHKLLL